jgi:membrane-bound lytic murein transglycosylase
MHKKMAAAAFAASIVMGLSACESLDPLKQDIAGLKTQVARLQSQLEATSKVADAASTAANAANLSAVGAQHTANQAAAAAQSGQACCVEMNEKIERAFRRSISK